MTYPKDGGPRGLLLTILVALIPGSCGGADAEESAFMAEKESAAEDERVRSSASTPATGADAVAPNARTTAAGEAAKNEKKPQAAGEENALPAGRWFELRAAADDRKKARGEKDRVNGQGGLAGMGYSDAYEEGGEFSGAIVHDASQMEPGLTLFCSGHDTSVLLIDVEGEVVHHWHLDFDEVFPDPLPFEVMDFHTKFVRRAWPFPNGDLLAIFEYTGITRVDADGKPLWTLANRSHHDFKILADGTIVTLDIEQRSRDWINKQYRTPRFHKGAVDSHVVFVSAEGEILRKFSIFEAIHRSRFAALLNTISHAQEDIFHANSVDVFDAAAANGHAAFEAGDILVSLRNPSVVVVIDGESEEVKWISSGISSAQHQASFLPTGSVLLLDNCGGNQAFPLKADRSRVIEIAPQTQEILWRYPPLGPDVDFFTGMLGYAERLPGGNTLITESTQGHLLEVTLDGEVVWEYYSPYRAGENDELITTLMGARRIPRAAMPFLEE